MKFVLATFVLATFVTIRNISAVSEPISTFVDFLFSVTLILGYGLICESRYQEFSVSVSFARLQGHDLWLQTCWQDHGAMIQAEAELGQAQLKLGLDFSSINWH